MGNLVPIGVQNGRIRCPGFFWRAGLLCAFLTLGVGSSLHARTRETGAPSFSIDLDQSYNDVVSAVEDVARSNSIKGTFEYRSDGELAGAQFGDASRLFPAWSQPGTIFYKVRTKALSPAHFLNSNDVGTVAVRYVVEELGPASTRLFIDAVFVENARHHGHPSDGYVETCEFAEIGKRLKNEDELRVARLAGPPLSPGNESSSRSDHGVADDPTTRDLEKVIAEQRAQLNVDTANLEKLEAEIRRMRTSEFAHVSVERTEMKAQPYAHAPAIEALKKGHEVTILARSIYWYRVRSEDGQEGWISHKDLEEQP